MHPSWPLLMALAWAAPAQAEPSLSDLALETQRANHLVEACESGLRSCSGDDELGALARAFYTQALAAYVHGRPADVQAASNVALLSPTLFRRLPVVLQDRTGAPTGWVEALVNAPAAVVPSPPALMPEAAVEVVQPEPPNPWIARYQASARGDGTASAALSQVLDANGMHAASLMVLRDAWYQGHLSDAATVRMVALARTIGGRQPLVELAQHRATDDWPASVRPDVHLARGLAYQGRGEVTPALKSFGAIDVASVAYVQGEYQTGELYRQSGEPWVALRAFQSAWEAEGDGAADERIREQAVWQLAELNQELGRPGEAIALYEVLTIGDTPLVHRAALQSAWVAHDQGNNDLALRWIPALPAMGVVSADVHLLRASLAKRRADSSSAGRYLDTAGHGLQQLQDALQTMLKPGVVVQVALEDAALDPLFADRLAADPVWRSYGDHFGAIQRDRALLSEKAVDFPPEVRVALGKRLAVRGRKLQVQREQRARIVLSRLRGELVALQRRVAQLRAQVQR